MRIRIALLLGCTFAFCLCGCADFLLEEEAVTPEQILRLSPSAEPADMSVSQLLAQMRKVTDPKGNWLNCRSYYMLQAHKEEQLSRTTSTEKYSKMETFFRFDKNDEPEMRLVIYVENEPISTVLVTGGKCYTIEKNGTYNEVTSLRGKTQLAKFIGNSNPRVNEQMLYPEIELGIVYEHDVKLYRMICRPSNADEAIMVRYVDTKTFLPVRLEMVRPDEEGELQLYRSEPQSFFWVESVRVPKVTYASLGDTKTEAFVLEEFKLDKTFDDKLFQLPDKAVIDYGKVKD